MPDYSFEALSTYDFQVLARDLLQEKLGVVLESFGKGPDRGIDFRFQSSDGSLVVQCKHYSNYAEVFRILKRDEVPKVRRLRPSRYVLALSASLSPERKDNILQLFTPYCRETADILGREDLNNLLGIYSTIERKQFKLWLTSEAVLSRILHGGIWGDSELTLQRIRQRTSRYVPNPSLARARQILDEHHYCIVAGIPGIGKTTLAEILLIEHVDRHDFQAIRIANDLSEIKAVKNPDQRQIFYFDDFLGKTALDKLQKNEDRRLLDLVEEVAANDKWRFILTTREYILNSARLTYENLANPPVDLTPCIVQLSDYTEPIRARILYNHIYFSGLPDQYKRALLENRNYERILDHDNYNPRIVEHMTQARYATQSTPTVYFKTFLENLTNPARVWDHAFRFQLTHAAQSLLIVKASMPDEVLISDLESAFLKFHQYRRTKDGVHGSTRDFERAMKELDGNFVKVTLIGKDQIVTFHNPSISDFLEFYLAGSPNDVADVIQAISFFDQFLTLWRGQQGKRFSGIDTDSDAFIRALASQFGAPFCRIIRMGDGHGNIYGVRRWDLSFEAKTLFAADVAHGLKSSSSRSVLEHLVKMWGPLLEQGTGDKEGLVQLLRTLNSEDADLVAKHSIFPIAKKYLTRQLDEVDDFKNLSNFVTLFPSVLEPDELTLLRSTFHRFCAKYDHSWVETADDLRGLAEDFELIGERLAVDVEKMTKELKARAEYLESEPTEDDTYDEPDYEMPSSVPNSESIDVMFDGLLREIDERKI
jgi:hypothetical protein